MGVANRFVDAVVTSAVVLAIMFVVYLVAWPDGYFAGQSWGMMTVVFVGYTFFKRFIGG